MDILNRGHIAFKSLYRKLLKLTQEILNLNAWHLTTLLNTFNKYYCYDIQYQETRKIQPIFLNVQLDARISTRRKVTRLLSIEIRPDVKEPNNNIIILNFDSNANIIYKMELSSFISQYNPEEIYIITETYKNSYLHNNSVLESSSTYCIKYTDNDKHGIAPVYSDVCHIYKKDTSYFEDLNKIWSQWYINLEYVHENRVIYSGKIKQSIEHPPKLQDYDNFDKVYMFYYLFGLDLGFYIENFDKDDNYIAKSTIKWDEESEITIRNNKDLASIIFPRKNEHIKLPVYDDSNYRLTLLDNILYNEELIYEYNDALITYTETINNITQKIKDINSIKSYKSFLFSGKAISKIESSSSSSLSSTIKRKKYETTIDMENQLIEYEDTTIELENVITDTTFKIRGYVSTLNKLII